MNFHALTSLTLVAGLLLAPLPAQQATNSPASRPLLLANYYCWYHDDQHPMRPFLYWTYPSSATNVLAKKTQKLGEPPPNSVFRPLVGLYDSADPMVAEWHVRLVKAAGIDAFLVDWWDTHKKMLLPVHPGHDNSHFRDDPYVMPRRDGQTLRDFLRAATDARADYIMVTSWNEWPESTVVEPSTSWPDPYLYLKILAEWKGVPFTEPHSPALKGRQP